MNKNIMPIETEKAFDEIQHPYMEKKLSKLGIEVHYLELIMRIYKKSTINFTVFGEQMNVFSLRSGTWQRCLLSPFLFNIILDVLATAIRKENKIKCIQIKHKEIQLSLFADDMIVYVGHPKESIKALLELSEFSNVAGYKNQAHFYRLRTNLWNQN